MPFEQTPTQHNEDSINDEATRVEAVNIRLPKFWAKDPESWFLVIEARFRSRHITTDQRKFDLVIEAIEDVELIRKISDVLTHTPAINKYETLKTKLISRLSDSRNLEIYQLLEGLQLGDSKASELLREMRRLAKSSISDDVLQNIWLKRLPTSAQLVLSTCKGTLDELAQTADAVLDNLNAAQSQVMATSTSHTTDSSISVKVANLESKLDQLTLAIKALGKRDRRSRSRARSVSTDKENKLCYYHKRFGKNALKCNAPCSFKSNPEN